MYFFFFIVAKWEDLQTFYLSSSNKRRSLIIYTEAFPSFSPLFFSLQSVIFIRDHNAGGQEVSGYIDYAHRLKTQDFEAYFSGKKKLLPGRRDLW